jgi:DNA mismatch repair protein MutL
MVNHTDAGPRIKVLADRVAKIIAAGEVIDRPFSVVRELVDNSIDALASEIVLSTERGGIDEIRITDNGCGMSEEDIRLCWLPHATSKITEEEDIYKIRTLGFRGEALSSIGTCARLEIASCREGDRNGHRLIVHGGKIVSIDDSPAGKGTTVSVSDLFYNMPARKKFLKTPSGEQGMCRSVLIDKALPFENISFRFFAGKELKMFLPATSGIERVASVYSDSVSRDSLFEEELVRDDFSIRARAT